MSDNIDADALAAHFAEQDKKANTVSGVSLAVKAGAQYTPEEWAKSSQLSLSSGVDPSALASNPLIRAAAENRAKGDALNIPDLVDTHPRVAEWMTDPVNAGIAQNKVDLLQGVSEATTSLIRPLRSLAAGVSFDLSSGTYGLGEVSARVLQPWVGLVTDAMGVDNPAKGLGDILQKIRVRQRAAADWVAGDQKGVGAIEQGITSGFRSMGNMAPSLIASVYTGNPNYALLSGSALQGSQSATEALDKGKGISRAIVYGAEDAAAEWAGEKIGIGYLLKDLKAGSAMWKLIGRQMLIEVPSEMATTAFQEMNKWVNLNPEKSVEDYIKELGPAEVQTVIATITQTLLTAGIGGGVQRYLNAQNKEDVKAQTSLAGYETLAKLSDAAGKAAPVRDLDKARFKGFMQSMVEDTEVKELYVDANALHDALAQSPIESQQDLVASLPDVVAQLGEGVATDGLVRIPVADYATYIAGTDLDKALLPHLKTDVEGLTFSEVEQHMKSAQEGMQQEADTVLTKHEADVAYKADVQSVYDNILGQLDAAKRFRPDVNQKYAELQKAYYVVAAEEEGVTPSEMLKRFPLKIQAGDTLGAQADTLEQPARGLKGMPTEVKVDGKQVQFGPFETARKTAAQYAAKAGLTYTPPTDFVKVDTARAKRIADAFEAMPHEPNNPEVKAAYEALTKETLAQWEEVKKTGLKVEFIEGADPYGNPRKAILDVVENNHLWVYPTAAGFGGTESAGVDVSGNPLLATVEGETISGRPVVVNDIFRIVHDYFGHIKEGIGFRAEGEENAWRMHMAMFSPAAQRALTTETRGQNSWVNFGPFAEHNKTATGETTQYAPQKIGLLPEWVSTEGVGEAAQPSSDYGYRARDVARKATLEDFAPGKVKDLLHKTDWAILTAENPAAQQLTPEENSARMVELRTDLILQGVQFEVAEGKYSGNSETSLILLGVTQDQATAIGQKYGQESVLTRAGLVYPDGTVNPAKAVNTFDKAPDDFYTSVPATGALFSVDIDFDNRVPLTDGRVGEVTINATHFSRESRLTLSGRAYGTGIKGAEAKRLAQAEDSRIKERISFYVDEGDGVFPEGGVGQFKHEVTLTNMYDAAKNPLRFAAEDFNAFESAVIDAGFDGYYIKQGFGRQGTAVLLGEASRNVQVDLPTEYAQSALFQSALPDDIYERITNGDPTTEAYADAIRTATAINTANEEERMREAYGKDYRPDMFKPLYQSAVQTGTSAFKKWAKDLPLVPREDTYGHDFVGGEGVVVEVLHGTTGDFTTFDKERASPESDMGAGFYFTNEVADVSANYAGEGPDLTQRLQLLAERIASETDRAYDDPQVVKEAKDKLAVTHGGMAMPVFVRFENPLVVGGSRESVFDYTTVVDDTGDYVDESGSLVDFIIALRDTAGRYNDGSVEDVVDRIVQEAMDTEGVSASGVVAAVRESETFGYYTDDEGQLVSKEILRRTFETLGFDGVIDTTVGEKFGNMAGVGSDTVHFIAFEPTQIKSAIGNTGAFDITNASILAQPNRGSFNPATLTTSLLKDADLSTFLHESGHQFLELDMARASQPDAPQRVKDRAAATLRWFGVANIGAWNAMTLDEKRLHHEKFARGFEAYLLEGKAPSAELNSIFASFRSWLLHLYRRLTNLNVELTPEVRQVFDRMLATDEQIAAAEDARNYGKLALEGLSTAYSEQDKQATADSIEIMQKRSMRDMKWLSNAKSRVLKDLQKQAEEKRRVIHAEVTAEVMAEPINQARTFLRKGEMTDPATGELVKADKGFRLDNAALADLYPETMLARPDVTALRGMTMNNGLNPDLVAEMFGFRSGDQLVRELIEGEDAKTKIEAFTDQRMLEENGDLVDERAVEEAANQAVHNEARARFMATGLKALTNSPLSSFQLAKAATNTAKEVIAAKRVRDLHPAQYTSAETKANKEALKTVATDPVKAQRAQRSALLNNRLAAASMEALEEVRKGVEHMNKVQKKAAQSSMRGEYLTQMNALLDRFDLRKSVTLKSLDIQRTPLKEWLESEAERLSAVTPDIPEWVLNESNITSYKMLTMEEFRGVVDAVKSLELMARREENQYQAIRGMKFAEERKAILDRIREFHPEAFSLDGEPLGMSPKFVKHFGDKLVDVEDKFIGEFLNAETIIDLLEGGNFGVVNESLFGRMSQRADWKALRLKQIQEQLKPLFEQYSLKERHDFGRRDIAAEIGLSLTRENALVVALLHGNAEGRERLSNYGWDLGAQQAIINLLDAKDVKLAEGIWNLFDNDLWPELKALNERTRGKAPPKVEALPVQTKHGEVKGGYFRLKYDSNLDERAHHLDEGAAVKELLGGGLGMSAKTNQGSSTERKQNVTMRPRLDLGVFAEAVSETVHDLAFREAVGDTMRMLNNPGVQNTIKTVSGVPGYRALVARVREIAAPPRNPAGFIEKTLTVARKNTIVTLMSGVGTALQNFTGLATAYSGSRVGAGRLSKEIVLFYSPKMTERYQFAMDNSEYMKTRHNSFERDLQNQAKSLTVNARIMPEMGTWLVLMGLVDKGTSVPVWNAAFYEGMAQFGNDKAKAVSFADHTVRQTMGSGREIDIAQIMGGHGGWGQLKRTFTMFQAYFNGQLGQLVRSGAINKQLAKTNPALATARFTRDFMLIYVIPMMLTKMLLAPPDKDPEEWARNYTRAFAQYGMAMIPLWGSMMNSLWAALDPTAHNYGYKITPVESGVEGIIKGTKSAVDIATGEGDDKDLKNIIMGTSFAVGLPGNLVADRVLGTKAWLNDEAGPSAIIQGLPRK
jgi:hypothetical protein